MQDFVTTLPGATYASFTARATAFGIDQTILFAIWLVLILPFAIVMGIAQMLAWPFVFVLFTPAVLPFTTIIAWMYFVLQESSARQATVGKLMCGLKVTDMQGNRISFVRANVRFFSKFVSAAIMLLGFFMAAFTVKHQALHDIFADTLVLKKGK